MRHAVSTFILAAAILVAAPLAPALAASGAPSPGLAIVGDIGRARDAVLSGEPEIAGAFVRDALTLLAAEGQGGSPEPDAAAGGWIVVTGQVLVARPHRQHAGGGAGGVMNAGTVAGGLDSAAGRALGAAGFDIGFVRVLMPVTLTEARLGTARNLIDLKNYPEAALALQQAERGLSLDTVMLYDAANGRKPQ